MSDCACKICGFDGPGFYIPKDHPCPGNPNFGNPETRDLMQYGWSFGTYPKSCSKCPPDNEFLGSKDSYLCYNHAKEAQLEDMGGTKIVVSKISDFSTDPVYTNNVFVMRK